ncbi:hypothetical protein C4568_03260 [Candidatus Parcubacteria bacterium]|nr:MAG: hypothetical protein C4568_03260 [Candidatus Parcubacteria bacterium]
MDNTEEKFHTDGQTVHLRASEKAAIKKRVLNTQVPKVSQPVPTFFPFVYVGRTALVGLLFLIVGGSSLTYAAQQSAPGDSLYHLEMYVVEPIEEAIQITPSAKIAYSASRVEERLEELQQIKEDVPSEEVAIASENVKAHVQNVLSVLPEQPETEKNVDQLVKVSALLNVHEHLPAFSDEGTQSIAALKEDVTSELTDQVSEYANGISPMDVVQEVQQTLMETSALIDDAATTTDNAIIAEHLANVQNEVVDGNFDNALQEAVDAKVQALTQEYAADGSIETE